MCVCVFECDAFGLDIDFGDDVAKQLKHWILDQAVTILNPHVGINVPPAPPLATQRWAQCLVLHLFFRFLHASALATFTNAAVLFSPVR